MIVTERLLLRSWRPNDRAPFAALNADPLVMKHFPGLMSREQSDAFADRIEDHFRRHGYGLWAVEIPGQCDFIGFVGLWTVAFDTWFTPAVEVGWRLASSQWGSGYATEAAAASLRYGFEEAGVSDIVSFTAPANRRSIAVMERLGMSYAGEFRHPLLPLDHPLNQHLVYRKQAVSS